MRADRRSLIAAGVMVTVIGLMMMPAMADARPSRHAIRDAAMPPARAGGAMAPDASGNVVLFGGSTTSRALGDTWTWDGSTWTEQHPADAPAPRGGSGIAYDAVRHQTVLFGGDDGHTNFEDTWVWDGVTWTELHPAHGPPYTNFGVAMAYDAARQEIVLTMYGSFGDQTWLWNGVDWSEASPSSIPPGREEPRLAYDAARKAVVQFGGAYDCFETLCGYQDMWLWNGVNWKKLNGIQRPPRRWGHVMAYDPDHHEVVVFGGENFSSLLDDTWTWTGPDWVHADPAHRPLTRVSAMMTWDPAHHLVLMFGGYEVTSSRYLGDTWTWNGTDWTCVSGCS